MTRHSTAFEAERPVPAGDTVRDLVPDPQNAARMQRRPSYKKVQFPQAVDGWRRSGGACRRGVVRLGLLDGRPLPGLDR